ncbi:MAG: ammonium transporter, partial [Gammaproteobacteria bacterium]
WVGWFGFNAGSELAADGTAGMAMAVTQIATAAAALAWMFTEWAVRGKPTLLGTTTGAVAGLVAITPASGFVGPMGALVIGIVAGIICYFFAVHVKRALGYDDSLDVFGVHAIGGIVGALLTGVFAAPFLGGAGFAEGVTSIAEQLGIQTLAVVATIVYDVIATFIILKVIEAVIGLRVTEEEETEGLDISQHEERGYIL